MSDGELANHWPASDVDRRSNEQARLVSLSDLAGIVRRMQEGDSTVDDRVALIDLASEIDAEAAGTELAQLATALRRVAGG